ncbi:hypothetical protein BDK51DRAFT_12272, partial [Blyttiomyces helicus]
ADGSIKISMRVKPGAKMSQIIEFASDGMVGVQQLAAPPRDGEANTEAVRLLAEIMGVHKRDVTLVAGHKSREKVARVE